MRILKKLLRKQSASPGIVAISFLPNGFAVAICRYSDLGSPRLTNCEVINATEQQRLTLLSALVKTQHLEDYDCHILLTPEQYRTLSIEAPPVPPEELKQAINWRIADLIDYPVDQAVLDFYYLPDSNRTNTPKMLEVIVCNSLQTSTLSQLCQDAGLNVKVIDIQETALRNLATLLPENQQGVAVLHLQQFSGYIIIEKAGAIHLSRKFEHGYGRLTGQMYDEQTLLQEQNNLALEIQRSFDYVEHYYDIPPINSLAVVLMPNNTHDLINFLYINHGIMARAMDLSASIEGDILLSDATQNLCAPCIGASLRRSLELEP